MARRRLAFEELFLLAVGIRKLRSRREDCSCAPYGDLDLTAFYGKLSFDLTGAQRRAIGEILADFASGQPMNRLATTYKSIINEKRKYGGGEQTERYSQSYCRTQSS